MTDCNLPYLVTIIMTDLIEQAVAEYAAGRV